MNQARFVHTNLIAKDWKKLAKFYEEVFECKVASPERDLSGKLIEDFTGIQDAEIRGVHLRLPGYGDVGPTLEIFQYNHLEERPKTAINRPGLAHIAFLVDNVEAFKDAVIDAGGKALGKVVSLEVRGSGKVKMVYVTDPEGNVIELQHWS
ncbi:VOC family protein [[Eubacterium] cellulosolvens]